MNLYGMDQVKVSKISSYKLLIFKNVIAITVIVKGTRLKTLKIWKFSPCY